MKFCAISGPFSILTSNSSTPDNAVQLQPQLCLDVWDPNQPRQTCLQYMCLYQCCTVGLESRLEGRTWIYQGRTRPRSNRIRIWTRSRRFIFTSTFASEPLLFNNIVQQRNYCSRIVTIHLRLGVGLARTWPQQK